MELNNSWSFYQDIVCELYRDIAECYCVPLRVQRRELRVIEERVSKEGISFLTKALPRFGKAVDSALASGNLLSVIGFAADHGSKVPKFLGWLLSRVFDASGKELDQPDPIAFKHFKQLTLLVYKLEIPYDEETEKAVLDSFIKTEQDLPPEEDSPLVDSSGDSYDWRGGFVRSVEWLKHARSLVERVVCTLDPVSPQIVPRHGPGVVATGESVCGKTTFSRIYSHLEKVYPFTEWNYFNLQHIAMDIPSLNNRIKLVDEATAKVVLVPKDSRGPRLISCEPLEIQWIQQGLARALMDTIETSPLTRGRVNFRDQTVNRSLAMLGSLGQGWVTLDMKDASDRVSMALVNYLFHDHPRLLEALSATRSRSTLLPDKTVMRLKKYAPMGSALCFPVESLCFWALSVSAVKLTGLSARESRESVFVYGDDIIVRDEVYQSLLQMLPMVGLKFNQQKCCVARSFRESCGCDAYQGVDVTPIKLKTTWSQLRSPECLSSYVAFSNAMYKQGHYRTAELVRKRIVEVYGNLPYTNTLIPDDEPTNLVREFVPGFIPDKRNTANTLGLEFYCHEPARKVNNQLRIHSRYNSQLQRLEYRTWSSLPKKRKTPLDGYPEMLRRVNAGYGSRSITSVGSREGKHGGTYALVRRNRLKRTWVEG